MTNAGQANAATGDQGYEDAVNCATIAAASLGVSPDDVLLMSTGRRVCWCVGVCVYVFAYMCVYMCVCTKCVLVGCNLRRGGEKQGKAAREYALAHYTQGHAPFLPC